jgi:hypothetical protein
MPQWFDGAGDDEWTDGLPDLLLWPAPAATGS